MVSPKDRVRANIYKTLLEEEKKKNKKISMFSLSLFIVGVFTGTTYDMIKRNISPTRQLVAFDGSEIYKNSLEKRDIGFTIDDLFQADEIRINKRDFNTENLFVSDLQI